MRTTTYESAARRHDNATPADECAGCGKPAGKLYGGFCGDCRAEIDAEIDVAARNRRKQ